MPQENSELADAQKAVTAAQGALTPILASIGDTAGKEILGGVMGVLQTCLNHLADEAANLGTIAKEVPQIAPTPEA